MINSYLTVDDVTTSLTPKVINYLNSKNITPIMFCWGEHLLEHQDEAIYALQHGAILQNHSFSHPQFSALSMWKAKREIMKTERILTKLYEKAGVLRPFKLFRFPFGDNGGQNADLLQEFLKFRGFNHIDDTYFTDKDYFRPEQKQNLDVLWTFDYAEYNLRPGNAFTFEDVINRAKNFISVHEDEPNDEKVRHIVLIHDHEETEEQHPGYFTEQIDFLLNSGVKFFPPKAR